jgi:pyruvate dehydrogenase E1 component alpha subunit/2-oxoisovalerate dehydrogenase E1 component alpha subunit
VAPTLLSVLKEDGGSEKSRDPGLPPETLLELYRHMVTIRVLDGRMLNLQRQGRIGFYGPTTGQEATTVGSGAAAAPEDWIVPALREGYLAIMRGLPLDQAVAQLIGNSLDRCKGRQMPCHFTWRQGRYLSMSSVIGTQISHATGIAMAARIRKDKIAVLGYLGDGATSSNDFHAGLNFAAVFKAPVVFVCQNNHWSISVPVAKQTACASLADKAAAYGMPGVLVDGNDVLAVFTATRAALERARAGDGPTLIEASTYRRLGHSSSDDPTRYRDQAEVAAWEKKDPIDRFLRHLLKKRIWDTERDEALTEEIGGRIAEAVRVAEAAPPLDPRTLIEDVFAEPSPALRQQISDLP